VGAIQACGLTSGSRPSKLKSGTRPSCTPWVRRLTADVAAGTASRGPDGRPGPAAWSGIEPAAGEAGFGRLTVRPHPGGQLDWAEGSYHSVRGPIRVRWQRSGGSSALTWSCRRTARPACGWPSADPAQVRDADGRSPDGTADFTGAAGTREAVFEVGSGAHRFTGPAASGTGARAR